MMGVLRTHLRRLIMPSSSPSPSSLPSPASLRQQPWLALGGIAIASFLGCIDFTIVNTALPAIQAELGADLAQLQWVMTAFVMALSSCTIAIGQLADRHGRSRAMLASMAVFALASLGAGWSGSLAALTGWRLLQGAACAGLYTASAALAAALFSEQERGKALGLLFSVNGIGLAAGPVLGGLLVGTVGWRWIFLINVPLILLSYLLCRHRLPPHPARAAASMKTSSETGHDIGHHMNHDMSSAIGQDIVRLEGRFDWQGTLLWLAFLPCCLLLVSHGPAWGWLSPASLGGLGASLLLGLALWRTERRAASPLLDFALFWRRRFVVAAGATAALAFFYCAAFLLMPLYLGDLRHQDSITMGWLLLPATALMALASPLAGRASDRWGTSAVMAGGFAALGLSALMQASFSETTAWPWVVVAFACMGVGWGCVLGPSMTAALAALPGELSGTALGMAATIHNVGGALGLALASALHGYAAAAIPLDTPALAFLAGYRAVMLLLAAVCASAFALVTIGRRA